MGRWRPNKKHTANRHCSRGRPNKMDLYCLNQKSSGVALFCGPCRTALNYWSWISAGVEFYQASARVKKANETSFGLGTTSRSRFIEHKGLLGTKWDRQFWKDVGPRLHRSLKVRTITLNLTWYSTESQCSFQSTGCTCALSGVPARTHTAAFWTNWSIWSSFKGSPT